MNKTIVIISMAFTLLIFGCIQQPTDPEPIQCAADQKICPDGSSVGRTPPSCEFALCPVSETPTGAAITTDLDKDLDSLNGTMSGLEELEETPDFPINPTDFE
jgi:hypothetical protein